MHKAIKLRIYPSTEQSQYIANLFGCCRFVFNKCLSYSIKQYAETKQGASWGELGKYITFLKKTDEYGWLNNVHSKPLSQALIDLNTAKHNFFVNGKGFPKFKSKKEYKQSCRFPNLAISKQFIIENQINLIKELHNIPFKCSKRDQKHLEENRQAIKSATLSKTRSGNYYLSVLIEFTPDQSQIKQSTTAIGLDLGIKSFIVDSNNQIYENKHFYKSQEHKLKRLQRQLSKKKPGSKNRNKARIKLSKAHEKITNQKQDYLHKTSTAIIRDNQTIIVENLNIAGMLKNHCFAKALQEMSMFEFKRQLKYKALWYTRTLVEIDRFYPSSKTCSCCGYKNDSLTLSNRTWTCIKCDTEHDRDHNAAKNIRAEGLRILGQGMSEVKSVENEKKSLFNEAEINSNV